MHDSGLAAWAGAGDAVALVEQSVGPAMPVVVTVGDATGMGQGLVNVSDVDDGLGRVGGSSSLGVLVRLHDSGLAAWAGAGDAVALVEEGVGPSVPVVVAPGVEAGVDEGFVNVFDGDDGLGCLGLGAGGCLLRHVLSLECENPAADVG